MKTAFSTLALVLACTSIADAGPIEANQVAAEAKWLVHVDFDQARQTELLKPIREQLLNRERVKQVLERIQSETGFDPTSDLHDATLYGTNFTPREGVLIVHAKIDRTKITAALKKKPDFKLTTEGGREILSWTQERPLKGNRTVVATFYSADVAVFSNKVDSVLAAVKVLEGKSGALSSNSSLAAAVPSGTVIQAGAVDLDKADLKLRSPMLRLSETASIALGESNGNVFIVADIETESAEIAKKVAEVLKGLQALAELHSDAELDLGRLLKDLKFEVKLSNVTVNWKAPATEVQSRVKELRAKKQEREAKLRLE